MTCTPHSAISQVSVSTFPLVHTRLFQFHLFRENLNFLGIHTYTHSHCTKYHYAKRLCGTRSGVITFCTLYNCRIDFNCRKITSFASKVNWICEFIVHFEIGRFLVHHTAPCSPPETSIIFSKSFAFSFMNCRSKLLGGGGTGCEHLRTRKIDRIRFRNQFTVKVI